MAHNLNFNEVTEKHSFVSVKELAWHKLGTVVEELKTSEDVIKHAQLDYEVGLMEVFGKYDEDTRQRLAKRGDRVPNAYATYRKDNGDIFGIVGNKYTVVQNREAFIFFDEIVANNHAKYETAGALGKGETIFISAKLNNYLKVKVSGKDDNVELYMFLSLAHDGTMSINAGITPIRIVCNNTLNMALRNNVSKVSIRHTASASDNLKEAAKVLNLIQELPAETEVIFNEISRMTMADYNFHALLFDLVLSDSQKADLRKGELSTKATNILKDINKYYTSHSTQKDIIGTGWGVYNAITGYYQNISNKDNTAKMNNILNGNEIGLKALKYLYDEDFNKSRFEDARSIKSIL